MKQYLATFTKDLKVQCKTSLCSKENGIAKSSSSARHVNIVKLLPPQNDHPRPGNLARHLSKPRRALAMMMMVSGGHRATSSTAIIIRAIKICLCPSVNGLFTSRLEDVMCLTWEPCPKTQLRSYILLSYYEIFTARRWLALRLTR